jgi:flavin-dependent dehydrogenase
VRALIVGAGPAGAAAAITLARAGAPHLLVERTRETGDALCGGFLSWRTLETLVRLGVDPEALSPRTISRVRLFSGSSFAEARLPRPAKAISRRALDTALLAAAETAGAAIERGAIVRAVGDGIATVDGISLSGPILLATGKHDVRGAGRPVEADPAMGLRVRMPATPALDRLVGDAVELHLFDRGYAGVALQEDGSANVCLALRRSRLREAGTPLDLLRALATGPLGDRLAGLDARTPIDAVANVPYGWRAAPAPFYRLGDQGAVIASLAGEGMGIALASGIGAATAHLGGIGPPAWQRTFARRARRPVLLADVVRQLVERPIGAAFALSATRALPVLMQIMARATRIGAEAP